MNMLVDDEWSRQFYLRNYGTFQEQKDAKIWLISYAQQHMHDTDTSPDQDGPKKKGEQ